MDLSHFKSPDVTPMLVKLYDKHKTYSRTKDKKPAARIELTEVIGELLGMNISSREQELIADVLISLLRQAETDLKQALSEKLAVLEDIPLRLVLEMANDDIPVASPVLRKSNILGDMDLVYIIKSKTSEYWQAIAKRENMSDHVMEVLAGTKDVPTAMNLLQNNNIILSNETMNILVDVTAHNQILGVPLLRRDELTEDIVQKIFKVSGEALKEQVSARYPEIREIIEDVVGGVTLDLVEATSVAKESRKANRAHPENKMLQSAALLNKRGLITESMLLKTLKRGQYQMFVALMAEFSGLEIPKIQKALTQPSGKCLAIICRAKNMMRSDFTNLFLLSFEFRSNKKAMNTSALTKALEYYDRIDRKTVQGLLNGSTETH